MKMQKIEKLHSMNKRRFIFFSETFPYKRNGKLVIQGGGEAYVTAYKNQYEMDTRIARIFNTFGPRMRADGVYGRAVPRFIKQAMNNEPITVFGDGSQTRSFLYVSDHIEGLLRLSSIEKAKGKVIDIGSDEETRIINLANMVKRLTNSKSKISFHPLPPSDPRRRCSEITKARKILNWKPRTSLENGLRKTSEWFKERR
jgi:UDP-glucuronate decarboxylase